MQEEETEEDYEYEQRFPKNTQTRISNRMRRSAQDQITCNGEYGEDKNEVSDGAADDYDDEEGCDDTPSSKQGKIL